MTAEIALLLGLLAVMAYLFLTEKLPIELTAFSGLVALVLAGFVPAAQAFDGFSSPVVITMLSIFFIAAALLHTGVADWIGERAQERLGSRERPLIVAIMAVTALLSSVMNNIAAAAMVLPAVASIARATGVSPSRLFMPLSFGAVLGGTTTLIGTPPNILVAEILRDRGLESFGLFDFTPIGVAICVVGILYTAVAAPRLLPARELAAPISRQSDLVQVYRLHDTLFSIRVPEGSKLAGRSLRDTTLGSALGVQVVGIERGAKRELAPTPDTVLSAGDILLVKGRAAEVRELWRIQGSEFAEAVPEEVARASERVSGLVARLGASSPLAGRTLRDLRFRERFGAIVIGIRRDGKLLDGAIAGEPLRGGDEMLALGMRARLAEAEIRQHFEVSTMGPDVFRSLSGRLYVLAVPEASGLVGTTLGESHLGELVGLTIWGILRAGETLLALEPSEQIRAGDRLLVAGPVGRIRSLLDLGNVELLQDVAEEAFVSDGVGVVEAAVAPRSACAGKTLREIRFRAKHGLQVLAVWREGQLIHSGLAELALRFGDALLLQGPWDRIRLLADNPDFLILSSAVRDQRRTRKAPFALGALALMVVLVVLGVLPVHMAAFTAATLVLLSRAITMEEAYRAVEWRAVFLMAAILPVGLAMETSGAAALLSESVTATVGPAGPFAVLAALVLLSSLLSQTLDGAPAVVLLAPVALSAAEQLGISARPIMMGVGLAASAAYMTPFSQKANLLVMGVGGYRVSDYLKLGTPLTLLQIVLIIALVPLLFPF
ncbi:MAG: SLC13 family permease [Candidatus Eiseniibacteriota bacterium]